MSWECCIVEKFLRFTPVCSRAAPQPAGQAIRAPTCLGQSDLRTLKIEFALLLSNCTPYKRLTGLKWFLKTFLTIQNSQLKYQVQPDTPCKSFNSKVCIVDIEFIWYNWRYPTQKFLAPGQIAWNKFVLFLVLKDTVYRNFSEWNCGKTRYIMYINYLKPHLKGTACKKSKGGWVNHGETMHCDFKVSRS